MGKWLASEDARLFSAAEVETISTEGLFTDHLEQLIERNKGEVSIELLSVRRETLSLEAASFLGEEEGLECIVREVMMIGGGERLVFARTVLPIARSDEDAIEIFKNSQEPIGKILVSRGVDLVKESMEVGIVAVNAVAMGTESGFDGFGKGGDNPRFVARRYVIRGEGRGAGVGVPQKFKAAVIEVMGPKVIAFDKDKHPYFGSR